jgi:hypothetical protein
VLGSATFDEATVAITTQAANFGTSVEASQQGDELSSAARRSTRCRRQHERCGEQATLPEDDRHGPAAAVGMTASAAVTGALAAE